MGCSTYYLVRPSGTRFSYWIQSDGAENEDNSNDRDLDRVLNHTGRNSVACQSSGFVDRQLIHQGLPMFLDCLYADLQFRSNLFVCFTFGDKL